jgi:hypothetical protein
LQEVLKFRARGATSSFKATRVVKSIFGEFYEKSNLQTNYGEFQASTIPPPQKIANLDQFAEFTLNISSNAS